LLVDIRRALNLCLPGCRWILGKHNYRIYPPNGAITVWFPSGAHGKKPGREEIERKHVMNMAEIFGITDCMKEHLEGL